MTYVRLLFINISSCANCTALDNLSSRHIKVSQYRVTADGITDCLKVSLCTVSVCNCFVTAENITEWGCESTLVCVCVCVCIRVCPTVKYVDVNKLVKCWLLSALYCFWQTQSLWPRTRARTDHRWILLWQPSSRAATNDYFHFKSDHYFPDNSVIVQSAQYHNCEKCS